MAFAWSELLVTRLCSLKCSRSVRLVSYTFFFTSFTVDHTLVSSLMIFTMNQIKKGEGKITYQK